MRVTLFILLLLIYTACGINTIYFEKEYYEKTTNIQFPPDFKVLETFDNGEFLTGTVFQADSLALRQFIVTNNFEKAKEITDTQMLSAGYFKHYIPVFNSILQLYFIKKSKGKVNWTYIADLNSNRLWAEISYPDWGGR